MSLNLLTPERTAKKWLEYLGGAASVLEKARKDYESGEYQWVAQVTKELVFADPANQEARNLCADAIVTCEKMQFAALLVGQSPKIHVTGDGTAVKSLFAYCSAFTPTFNIIEP